MGRGSYTAGDWASLRSSRKLNAVSTVESIFTNNCAVSAYDSRNVVIRESRDSEEHNSSTPVIIGFDVTASMGYLAKTLATETINYSVNQIIHSSLSNPQFLIAAIGDVKCDNTPLQVTQFESDIRINTQLMELHLEGGGGGNGGESYNLLWWFAAKHTSTDAFEKRGKKGFLFTIGDDNCHEGLSVVEIGKAFRDTVPYSVSNQELIAMAEEKYHVIHIHINNGTPESRKIFRNLRDILPGKATEININDLDCLSYLISSIVKIRLGASAGDVMSEIPQEAAVKLARSISFAFNDNRSGGSLFF
ncbi:MAG: hypothetical protein K6A80_09750 [Saccharofermentans sp.]|nr:hypothetical protein [Saccharofermentans sp.]